MKYPKEYLDEIKLRLKVSQIVGKTVKLKKRGKEFIGLHHIGFLVDDLGEAEAKIENAGGKYFMGRPDKDEPDTFYEMKFRDPNGVIVDATHLGWRTEPDDVTAKEMVSAD